MQDGPEVLHNISFELKSGERVGVGACPYTSSCTYFLLILTQPVGNSWPYWQRKGISLLMAVLYTAFNTKITELTYSVSAPMHCDGRYSVLRWTSNEQDQLGCSAPQYYYNSTSRMYYSRVLSFYSSFVFHIKPELISGTLRQNLDIFDEHDDATLNDALRAAGLFSLQKEDDEGRITLDTAIAAGGSNLSVGQIGRAHV